MDNSELKMNSYLDEVNHAPYGVLFLGGISALFLLTFVILLGIF